METTKLENGTSAAVESGPETTVPKSEYRTYYSSPLCQIIARKIPTAENSYMEIAMHHAMVKWDYGLLRGRPLMVGERRTWGNIIAAKQKMMRNGSALLVSEF